MNRVVPLVPFVLAVYLAGLAGCSRAKAPAPESHVPEAAVPAGIAIHGQIHAIDAGSVQKTGLAPVWIYDAANAQLTTPIPLPKFGGRTRQDWQRIVTACPKSLTVYSNYQVLQPLGPQAEVKRMNAKDDIEQQKLYAEENRLWDQADDARELIVLWYNLNPGLLYAAGLPEPLAMAQTDQDGNFTASLPPGKKVLIAAHIEGKIDGQAGNYFWLVPFDPGAARNVVLGNDNVSCRRTRSQMPQIILPETNGFIGNVGFWMLNRVRDARHGL